MTTNINLRDLALERSQPPGQRKPRKSSWLSRYAVPGLILFGFVGLLSWALRDQFVSRKPVTVVPVIVTRAEVRAEGTPLFQAAGWIEPRPTPVMAAAMTEGVVEALLVVEGQSVRAGEPVARLVAVDAQLALKEAESSLALQEAELLNADAELKGARLRRDHPTHLEVQLADAESQLARIRTDLAKLPFLIQQARAKVEYAKSSVEGKRSAVDVVSVRSLQLAESEFIAAEADLKELQEREPLQRLEEKALLKKKEAMEFQLKLLIEESRQVESAQAKQQAARALRDHAQLRVEKARLNLERTVVCSPINGRVMQLAAHPGMRVMGMESTGTRGASTVVTLYDPKMLQVRADVRLEDVPLVQPGQPVTLQTASAKEVLQGFVLQATSSANVQKNTLEVKISLENPPETVRPEMLVTATFLAPPQAEAISEGGLPERMLVPRQLVGSSGNGSAIWIVTASGTAHHRTIQLGKTGTDQLVEVSGLTVTDKLIAGGREGLREGDRVEVTGDDATLGVQSK